MVEGVCVGRSGLYLQCHTKCSDTKGVSRFIVWHVYFPVERGGVILIESFQNVTYIFGKNRGSDCKPGFTVIRPFALKNVKSDRNKYVEFTKKSVV